MDKKEEKMLKIIEKFAEKLGRPLPKTDQRTIFDLWYNKILPKFYPQEELDKYCCEIPFQ